MSDDEDCEDEPEESPKYIKEPLSRKYNQSNSEYDDEEEEELREEVCELPPKIEDMQVDEYEEDEIDSDDNGDEGNELPTVVIDSSMDEKELA